MDAEGGLSIDPFRARTMPTIRSPHLGLSAIARRMALASPVSGSGAVVKRVLVTGGAGQISYALIPHLISGKVRGCVLSACVQLLPPPLNPLDPTRNRLQTGVWPHDAAHHPPARHPGDGERPPWYVSG